MVTAGINLKSTPKLGTFPLAADIGWVLAFGGRNFIAGDGDQNDRVTGQTSFANTTPTFLFHNPVGSRVYLIGPFIHLNQTGTVGGGDISVEVELVAPSAYASGGTSEKVRSANTSKWGLLQNQCLLYSGPTATAGYGIAIDSVTLAPDISPAEGIINIYEYQGPAGMVLAPGSSLNIFTSAGTTGPTWAWHAEWWEIPEALAQQLIDIGLLAA